jgi:hypothetical protein
MPRLAVLTMAVALRSLSAAAAMALPGVLTGRRMDGLPLPPDRRPRMLVCSYARVKCADDMEFV